MNSVLLVNANNNIALAITRALGARGVPVAGVGFADGGVGMRSRYLRHRFNLSGFRDITPDFLARASSVSGARYLMAMGEQDLAHLNSLRPSAPPGLKFLFPPQNILQRAFDKAITLDYARRLDIPVPDTFQISSLSQLDGLLPRLHFPLVLKFPTVLPDSVPQGLYMKYCYAHSPQHLSSILAAYSPYNVFPLIQEYLPGKGLGVELCLHHGQVVGALQHERLHELPLSGGVSTLRKAVPLDPVLLDQSLRLLRAMEWEGVAMVEFRWDAASNRTLLMEVNGRFWGSLPLAVRAGVNFPYLLYLSMGEGLSPEPPPYRIGLKVRNLAGDLKWYIHAAISRRDLPPEGFMSRARVLYDFLLSLDPRIKFDIEDWRDPLPALRFWLQRLPGSRFFLP